LKIRHRIKDLFGNSVSEESFLPEFFSQGQEDWKIGIA
jgi:hypothetical protein